ncbi:hypothetical protein CALCODRAFT_494905 [Calocera cornea HHB12733]|uniref:Proteasome assembly chaperone 2 n=1 Tax=Calocera cornea HHB12733 TaxID=1353952 RepID=A0A165GSC4_9BASI|nr:hypothetical protein CALCODRAFT_494905 [Calocera cornea HHB12733]
MEILDPACVFPVAGQREDGREGVTTPLEVFGKEGVNIVVLQQRSPAISALKSQFTAQLATFVRRGQFAAVLLLSGVDVMARGDRHMSYASLPPSPS